MQVTEALSTRGGHGADRGGEGKARGGGEGGADGTRGARPFPSGGKGSAADQECAGGLDANEGKGLEDGKR
jgi:hypothetical protein